MLVRFFDRALIEKIATGLLDNTFFQNSLLYFLILRSRLTKSQLKITHSMNSSPAYSLQSSPISRSSYRLSLLATCSLIASFSVAGLSAATRTWVGNTGIGEWNSNANWDSSRPNTNGNDDIVFNNTVTTNTNNITNLPVNGITFGTSAGAFNLSGNQLTLGPSIGLVNNNANNTQTVSLAMVLTGATPFSTVTSGQTVITGALSGAGGLSISGGGTLSLNNTNTYIGATTLAASTGTVNLNGTTSGTTFTINGGRFNVNGSTTGGSITANAGTLGGDGTITGNVTIGSTAILDVGSGGVTDRTLVISGSVTSSGTMKFRVGGEAAADRDMLTLGSVDLSSTTLDFTFTDASVAMMSDATQASAFLSNPTTYTSSSVYQIISGATSNNFAGLAAMDLQFMTVLGLSGPQYTTTSGSQLFWVANTGNATFLVAIPETSTALLSVCGLLGLAIRRRR
jgi:hypothetical protein